MIDTHHRPRDFHLDRGRVIVLPSFVSPVSELRNFLFGPFLVSVSFTPSSLPRLKHYIIGRKVGCFFFEKNRYGISRLKCIVNQSFDARQIEIPPDLITGKYNYC